MKVSEAIAELRNYPLDADIDLLKVTVKIGKRTSKLDYSYARNKRLGMEARP